MAGSADMVMTFSTLEGSPNPLTGRRQTAAPPWAPRRAHGGWHRHGFAEIRQTGAAIGPGIEPRIRRQSTGAKLVEGGKAGLAKDRPEVGIAGEEVGFDGGKTAGEFGETALTPSSFR